MSEEVMVHGGDEIAELDFGTMNLPSSPCVNKEALLAIAGEGGGYCSLRLASTATAQVVEDGVCSAGDYYLDNQEKQVGIGNQVDVIFVAYRALAVDYADSENVIRVFDDKDPRFKEIVQRVDQLGQNANAMFGIEFLVAVRGKGVGGSDLLCNFYCNNKSLRISSRQLMQYADHKTPATISSKKAINKKNQRWHTLTISEADVPFSVRMSRDAFMSAMSSFTNPQASDGAVTQSAEKDPDTRD